MRPTRDQLVALRTQTALDNDQTMQVFAEIDALTNAHKNIATYANDAYIKDTANASAVTLGKALLTAKAAVAGTEITPEPVTT